ncbi:hypothetical protein BDV28DRAFT_5586 [Aspergillus coremiiformis]|uniref:Uncharacterized protein n=1 Tax=Aspergillus coremiiformis TaxID=138285 RepID=A0A5N6Z522_9EURO|nr:hypothetical protein BDV28DRAFT_5586 [Aspergillus coremiiformis]
MQIKKYPPNGIQNQASQAQYCDTAQLPNPQISNPIFQATNDNDTGPSRQNISYSPVICTSRTNHSQTE